jgi:two-component system sensor histidine kinase CpxA
MPLRIPLYGKILFWFFANLLLVSLLAYGFAKAQFRLGLDGLLEGGSGQRLTATCEVIAWELRDRPQREWNAILARYSSAHRLRFALFRPDGRLLAGSSITLPQSVAQRLQERPPPPVQTGPHHPPEGPNLGRPPRPEPPMPQLPPRSSDLDFPNAEPRPEPPRREFQRHAIHRDTPPPPHPPAQIAFFMRAGSPAQYWVGVRLGLPQGNQPEPRGAILAMVSETITGGGMFFDPLPWAIFGAAALGISALVWFPIAGGITRSIRRVNTAARRIAGGGFDTRIDERRRDELGELAGSVNAMAEQLGDYVGRQRRLTADVAHELCSPIARMQRALGLVEQRATPEQAGYVEKLDRELQHMARLVEEVLSFSRTQARSQNAAPVEVPLYPLAIEVAGREASEVEVQIDVPESLSVTTVRDALERALGNVLRNSVRYASHAGLIRLVAAKVGDGVEIKISDSGPGVPPETLEKIFEPFYRPEAARQRSTGGSGLGLAIVRSCVEVCRGKVSAEIAEGGGLCVRIWVPNTPDSQAAPTTEPLHA